MRYLLLLIALPALALAQQPMSVAQPGVGERLSPQLSWPLELFVDFRLVDGQPRWPERLRDKLDWANAALQTRDHELDVACPVELSVASVTVYRAYEDGLLEGGSLAIPVTRPDGSRGRSRELRMPHDTLAEVSAQRFDTTRLYLAPGPGWAHARPWANAAYGWVGEWEPGKGKGRGGGTAGLIDPWGRRSGWVIVHELGHVAGNGHRSVRSADQCSLMSYTKEMFPVRPVQELCPHNARRLVLNQCAHFLRTAQLATRRREQAASGSPGPGTSAADRPPPCLGWTRKGACDLGAPPLQLSSGGPSQPPGH